MILDASVAAKWCIPDEADPRANELLRLHHSGRLRLTVPDLFWTEITNLLTRAVRRGRVRRESANEALQLLQQSELITTPAGHFCTEAFDLACRWQWPVQDLFYALVARARHEEFVTADERMVRALGSRFPVRWLGALTL